MTLDREILRSEHDVVELDLSQRRRISRLGSMLQNADLVFAWFASLHSALPVLAAAGLGKPSIVVVGGYDTANMPEIGYGHMGHPIKRHIVRAICQAATVLVANSSTAATEVRRNVGASARIEVIYHGFPSRPTSLPLQREAIVLSVGNVNRENLRRKGHELFVHAARLVPEARFILVGRPSDGAIGYLRSIAPGNAEFPNFVSQNDLDCLLERASVYVQASEHEGFGCAVAEAMLAGCVPVVAARGALPEVVGEQGLYLERLDAQSVAQAIRSALQTPGERRPQIAARIATRYPLEVRRRAILQLVADVGSHRSAG